jgi:hypothetical protein
MQKEEQHKLMDAAQRMILGVIDTATSPLGAVGLASLQAGDFGATREDALQMYTALQPFRDLFPGSEQAARYYPTRPLPWSALSMNAGPGDASALLERMRLLFPNGVPAPGSGPIDVDNAPAQLQLLYDSAQRLLQSENPADQLLGQEQMQRFQTLLQLFSTLLSLRAQAQKMLIENTRSR